MVTSLADQGHNAGLAGAPDRLELGNHLLRCGPFNQRQLARSWLKRARRIRRRGPEAARRARTAPARTTDAQVDFDSARACPAR